MSEMKIKDGTGAAFLAAVTSEGKLKVQSTTEPEIHHHIELGHTWNLESGYQTLTSANASDILYLKNTGSGLMHIDLYIVLAKESTGGSGDLLVEILRNPLAGTVVSDAVAANAVNMNFGHKDTPQGDYYSGGEGKTLTGHDNALVSKATADSRLLLGVLTVLPQGASMGVRITPPTGNTSVDVNAVVEFYETEEIT